MTTTRTNSRYPLGTASAMSAAMRRSGFSPSWKGGKAGQQGLAVASMGHGLTQSIVIRAEWDDPRVVERELDQVAEWLTGAGFTFDRDESETYVPTSYAGDGSLVEGPPVVFPGGRRITIYDRA